MKIIITGTPGTGKTSTAKKIAGKMKLKLVNEKSFALKTKTGKKKGKETEVDLKKFRKKMNEFLKKEKNVVLEGHLLCEIKLNADYVFVLRTKPELLEKRLRKRNYSEIKILDNVFCEKTNYCGKKAGKNYVKVIEVSSNRNFEAAKKILEKIR